MHASQHRRSRWTLAHVRFPAILLCLGGQPPSFGKVHYNESHVILLCYWCKSCLQLKTYYLMCNLYLNRFKWLSCNLGDSVDKELRRSLFHCVLGNELRHYWGSQLQLPHYADTRGWYLQRLCCWLLLLWSRGSMPTDNHFIPWGQYQNYVCLPLWLPSWQLRESRLCAQSWLIQRSKHTLATLWDHCCPNNVKRALRGRSDQPFD